MKRKPTSQAWQELVEQRQAQAKKNNELAANANHASVVESDTLISQLERDVNNARYKFKNRPYGKSAAQRMANQGQLHKYETFGYNDYCRFKRGLVSHVFQVCGEPYVIMLPATKGSGSRGSRFKTK
tara:strand:- start:58 stop:438 length:381 start_codon:yes stop_codon:yes gene_type:complete